MAHCIFLSSVIALSQEIHYTPSKIVKVSSLPERRWHVAVFVVLRRLPGEIDQPLIDSQLFLHATSMLPRCRQAISDFLL